MLLGFKIIVHEIDQARLIGFLSASYKYLQWTDAMIFPDGIRI